jgi:hypothetical protein
MKPDPLHGRLNTWSYLCSFPPFRVFIEGAKLVRLCHCSRDCSLCYTMSVYWSTGLFCFEKNILNLRFRPDLQVNIFLMVEMSCPLASRSHSDWISPTHMFVSRLSGVHCASADILRSPSPPPSVPNKLHTSYFLLSSSIITRNTNMRIICYSLQAIVCIEFLTDFELIFQAWHSK